MKRSTIRNKPLAVISLTLDKKVHNQVKAIIKSRPALLKRFDIKISGSPSELAKWIAEAEVFCGFHLKDEHYNQASNLRWIHLASAGVDGTLPPEAFKSRVRITCSKGLHVSAMAETAMGMIITLAKNLRVARDYQIQRRWDFHGVGDNIFSLEDKTLGIVGAGRIGKAIAGRARCFKIRVIGVNRSGRRVVGFEKIRSINYLPWLLKQSDIVILTIPLTKQTNNLIGARQFALMKKGSYFINIARGAIVDQQALVDALKNRHIAGAALDVFTVEPLPEDSSLWGMQNVIITPHIGGMMPDLYQKIIHLFLNNLERYIAGKKLYGIVNKKKGY